MSQTANVHYEIVAKSPGTHLFAVSILIQAPDPQGQRLDIPAWIPGSYLVRDFAGQILEVSATAGRKPVAVSKTDKSSWVCAPCQGPLEIRYNAYANDLSVRGAHLDTTHGYFNGPRVFLRVAGLHEQPCTLTIHRADDAVCADWHVATSMHRVDAEPHGFGTYRADDYEELIDHPVEMGRFETQYFEAHGIPHQLVVTGRHHGDLARIGRDVKSICEAHIDMFGLPAPIDRYVFLTMLVGDGYGGLEHRWSSSLMARRDDMARFGETQISEQYRRFLGLVSHEYFHLWNVKRIRPEPVAISDLASEAYTRQLWVFEGITSYYDDMAMLRSGVIDLKSYLELVSNIATIVSLGQGRRAQSLSDSSFDAWIKFYKRDENAPNSQVSYYTKGALVALGLDLYIRSQTQARKSLDDVMRVVWQRHGQPDVPLPEGRFEEIAAEVTGVALSDYFESVVRGTDDPPLTEFLQTVGLQLERRPVLDGESRPMKPEDNTPVPMAMQIGTRTAEGRLLVSTVYTGGPAQQAGLACGDELLAINGVRVTPANYQGLMRQYRDGEPVEVAVFRRDELHHFNVRLATAPQVAVVISENENALDEVLARRHLWLTGKTLNG